MTTVLGTTDPWTAAAIIIGILAVIQSIFGMGILVFGTPTLLLLGASFPETLATLLPSSVTISAMQAWGGRKEPSGNTSHMAIFCIPGIVLGLALMLGGYVHLRIDALIGVMLLGTAAIRGSSAVRAAVARYIRTHERIYLAIMGLVHGLTNMGGALLLVYASNFHDDKAAIRRVISKYYLLFGLTQLCMLVFLVPEVLTPARLALLPIPLLVYFALGERLYNWATQGAYQRALTMFTVAYGCAILAKPWL